MLSREQVLWIRSHYIPRDKTYGASALSRKFHVCVTVINDVINHQGGYRWDA